MADDPFLSRWSRRKLETRRGAAVLPEADEPDAAPAPAVVGTPAPAAAAHDAPPDSPPTLEDVQALTPAADFSRFVRPGVDADVQRAALKKLFADPQFNVMDGLDVYIDDYHTPDPLPASMLRQMVQAQLLGLFDETPGAAPEGGPAAAPAAAQPSETARDEDPDLRLQPHDAAGRPGPEPGAGPHAGGEP